MYEKYCMLLLVALGTDDGDDLEMYGSEVTAATNQQTSYSFEVRVDVNMVETSKICLLDIT